MRRVSHRPNDSMEDLGGRALPLELRTHQRGDCKSATFNALARRAFMIPLVHGNAGRVTPRGGVNLPNAPRNKISRRRFDDRRDRYGQGTGR